ncbi:MAG TPA: hypothetical protein VMG14_07850 [Thermoplasmata archaeon]|jgi:hypothetical protein|nr:hypothetical protein [Thermoplasmata archaeon]
MILATARVLKNVIDADVGGAVWQARPVQSEQSGVGARVAALFSTEYHTFLPDRPDVPHSTISYHRKNDQIRIQVGDHHWRTQSTAFGPMTIDYDGRHFTINERLTGRFGIVQGDRPAATVQLGFRSCRIEEYAGELEPFLANLAIGYVIRTLTWENLFA